MSATVKYRIGSFCHCGFPDECDNHWQVETDEWPEGYAAQHVIAADLNRENAELIVTALSGEPGA